MKNTLNVTRETQDSSHAVKSASAIDQDPGEFNSEVLCRLVTYISQFDEFQPEGDDSANQSAKNIIACIERLRNSQASISATETAMAEIANSSRYAALEEGTALAEGMNSHGQFIADKMRDLKNVPASTISDSERLDYLLGKCRLVTKQQGRNFWSLEHVFDEAGEIDLGSWLLECRASIDAGVKRLT